MVVASLEDQQDALGVDRFLDMCRTTLNVVGDLAAAVYVARGEPDDEAVPATATVPS